MYIARFTISRVIALVFVSGILVSCGDNPVDPQADDDPFDRAILGVHAEARDRSVEVSWSMGFLLSKGLHESASRQFRLFFSDNGLTDLRPIVQNALGDGYSGSRVIHDLENGKPYYFAVQIDNPATGRVLSRAVMAVPHVENPTAYVLSPQSLEQRYAAWSPDGRSIAYIGQVDSTASDTGQEYSWDVLFVYDLASRQSVRFVNHAAGTSWAPDSKRLSYRLDHNRKSVINVLDIETRVVATLTDGGTEDLSPSWSQSGRHIAYISYVGRSNEIRVYDFENGVSSTVATGEVPWFSPSGLFSTPSWTPGAEKIVFARRRIEEEQPQRDIYTMNVGGGDMQPLLKSPWDDHQPAFSPDGRRLAFLSNRSGRTDVWTLDLASERLAQLTSEAIDRGTLSWSPDGSQIVFIGHRDHLRTLRTVTVPQ